MNSILPRFLLECNESNQMRNDQAETERDRDKGHKNRLLMESPKQVRTVDTKENRAIEKIENAVLEKAKKKKKGGGENLHERTQS